MGRSTLISPNTTQAHIQTTSRMNKLLMLAFLVTLMGLMATAAPQEEVDDMELEEFDMEEAIESREAREAGRRRKGHNKKKEVEKNDSILTRTATTFNEDSSKDRGDQKDQCKLGRGQQNKKTQDVQNQYSLNLSS